MNRIHERLPPEKTTADTLRRLAILGGLAIEMSFSVAAGTVLGYFLDKLFKTAPVLTIVCMFVGVLGGILTSIRVWRLLKERL